MANIKISAMPVLTTMNDTALIPVVDGSSNKRITGLVAKTYTSASPTLTGTPSSTGIFTINYVGNTDSSLIIAGSNTRGGAGYHDFLVVKNGAVGATNTNKSFRLNSTGSLEILNSAYSTSIMELSDGGQLTVSGNTLKLAGTAGGTINLTTDVTSGTVNIFTSATGTIQIGTSGSGIVGFASTATTSSTAASLGYLGMPQQSKSGPYTTVIGDSGKHIYVTATATMTINSNATVAYPIGTTITFIAGSGATATIAINSDTMYLGGTGTTGSRTLAPFGMATAVKVASTTWFINGTGLT